MSTVVTDLLGKRVTVHRCADHYSGCRNKIITGVVRGVASATAFTFTLLVQAEVVHCGDRIIGGLSVGGLSVWTMGDDGLLEVEVLHEP